MEDKNTTPFHDEDLKRIRKDNIKKEIHELNKDPLGIFYNSSGERIYKYNLILKNIGNLVFEISGELTDKEGKECERYENALTDSLLFNPIHELKREIINFARSKPKLVFHKRVWLKFRKYLYQYQKLVFKLDNKYSADTKIKIKQKEN